MSNSEITTTDNYDFFRANKDEYLKEYEGKYLLIFEKSLIDAFDDQLSAMEEALKTYEMGTFIVQHCVTDEDETMKFYSRVGFTSYASPRV